MKVKKILKIDPMTVVDYSSGDFSSGEVKKNTIYEFCMEWLINSKLSCSLLAGLSKTLKIARFYF